MKVIKKETNAISFKNIEIREALVEDLIVAERIAGSDTGINFALAVLSQVATFDGKKLPPEELRRLKVKDFLHLAEAMQNFGLEELAKQLSSSQEKQVSATEK